MLWNHLSSAGIPCLRDYLSGMRLVVLRGTLGIRDHLELAVHQTAEAEDPIATEVPTSDRTAWARLLLSVRQFDSANRRRPMLRRNSFQLPSAAHPQAILVSATIPGRIARTGTGPDTSAGQTSSPRNTPRRDTGALSCRNRKARRHLPRHRNQSNRHNRGVPGDPQLGYLSRNAAPTSGRESPGSPEFPGAWPTHPAGRSGMPGSCCVARITMTPRYPWYTDAEGDEIEQGDLFEACPV